MNKLPAQTVYDLKSFKGHVPLKANFISREDMNNLETVKVYERFEDRKEAENVLEEYKSLALAAPDCILITSFGLEEMEFMGEEYISTGNVTYAPFDESSVIKEEAV